MAYPDAPKLVIEQDGEGSTMGLHDFSTIEELKESRIWPHAYNAAFGILPYIRRLGDNTQGVEIGTERGESAYLILDECPNVTTLWTVDPYVEYENWNGPVEQEKLDKYKGIAETNLEVFNGRASPLIMTSDEAVDWLAHIEKVDFVFIDGSVDEEQYYQDMKNWYTKIRPGGLFAAHNYQLESVRNALKRFREEDKIRIPIQRTENMTFFWTKR